MNVGIGMRQRSFLSGSTESDFRYSANSYSNIVTRPYLHMVNIGQAARLNTGLVLGHMMLPIRINIFSKSVELFWKKFGTRSDTFSLALMDV
jgi:hypothetical protein